LEQRPKVLIVTERTVSRTEKVKTKKLGTEDFRRKKRHSSEPGHKESIHEERSSKRGTRGKKGSKDKIQQMNAQSRELNLDRELKRAEMNSDGLPQDKGPKAERGGTEEERWGGSSQRRL